MTGICPRGASSLRNDKAGVSRDVQVSRAASCPEHKKTGMHGIPVFERQCVRITLPRVLMMTAFMLPAARAIRARPDRVP
jgi:hypothetical protein